VECGCLQLAAANAMRAQSICVRVRMLPAQRTESPAHPGRCAAAAPSNVARCCTPVPPTLASHCPHVIRCLPRPAAAGRTASGRASGSLRAAGWVPATRLPARHQRHWLGSAAARRLEALYSSFTKCPPTPSRASDRLVGMSRPVGCQPTRILAGHWRFGAMNHA